LPGTCAQLAWLEVTGCAEVLAATAATGVDRLVVGVVAVVAADVDPAVPWVAVASAALCVAVDVLVVAAMQPVSINMPAMLM
jgi:hypothetical protein